MGMDNQKWSWLGILALFLLLIYFLRPILTPFFIAALLAYLGDPIVTRMTRFKIPRILAVVIVFVIILLLIVLLLGLLIPMLERQLVILVDKVPQFTLWLQTGLVPWIYAKTGIKEVLDLQNIQEILKQHWQQASDIAREIIRAITHSGYTLFAFLLNLVLIPVVSFYLLCDWDKVIHGIDRLIPRHIAPTVRKLACECNEVIGAFFRGQLLVMLSLAIYYSIGLSIVGLQLSLLIGVVVGLFSIVPYLGFIVGIVLTGIATFMQFYDWVHLGYVAIVFVIGHVLESYILAPMLVGDRIGLHPVAVIFAILAGGQLFGFIGILLALPLAAVVMVLVRHLRDHYLQSHLYAK
jgi:predicted PurR-regulated permease PerM